MQETAAGFEIYSNSDRCTPGPARPEETETNKHSIAGLRIVDRATPRISTTSSVYDPTAVEASARNTVPAIIDAPLPDAVERRLLEILASAPAHGETIVSATSVAMKGQRFADVLFDVKIGGPHKTQTSTVGVSVKGSGSNDEKTRSVELGASVTFSTSVSSQGTRSFRRAFRISSLNEPTKILDSSSGKPTSVDTAMSLEEVLELHEDFEDFELDDDDVGDDVTSFYANWVLHSYDD